MRDHIFQPAVIQFGFFIFISVALFAAVKYAVMYSIPHIGNEFYLIIYSLIFLGATWQVKMSELPKTMRILLQFVFVMFGIYMAFPLTLPAEVPELPDLTLWRLHYGFIFGPIICFLGLWRPAFGVIGAFNAVWIRMAMSEVLGQPLSYTEFYPIAEGVIFMVICAAFYPAAQKIKYFGSLDKPFAENDTLTFLEKTTLCALALHLANYFWSGVAKWNLGEMPWDWALNNQTWALMLMANGMGNFPLAINDTIAGFSVEAFQLILIIGNIAIFIGQLLAIAGGFRIRWIILLTAFYDVTHTAIFLASGIFFYKWIIFNLAIIAALTCIREKIIPFALSLMITGVILFSPIVFHIAYLGWWDLKVFNQEKFYAVTEDGQEVRVPTNYWGSFSVHYAQTRFVNDKSDGYFPSNFDLYSVVKGTENVKMMNRCEFKLDPAQSDTSVSRALNDDDRREIENIRLMHRYTLEHINDDGKLLYDFHPHHIWSMPWKFTEFYNLDKRKIVAYKYELDAVCLDYIDGEFTRDVKKQESFIIDVSDLNTQ